MDYTELSEAYDREIRAYKEWVRVSSEEPQAFKKKKLAYKEWLKERELLAEVGNRVDVQAMLEARGAGRKKRRKA